MRRSTLIYGIFVMISSSVKCLMVGVCMYAVTMTGGKAFHPCCMNRGWSMAYL